MEKLESEAISREEFKKEMNAVCGIKHFWIIMEWLSRQAAYMQSVNMDICMQVFIQM